MKATENIHYAKFKFCRGGWGVGKNDETTRCTYNVTPTLFLYFIHLFIVCFILFVNIYMLNTIKDRADDET